MSQNRIEKLQYFFKHFSIRLNERYNILITFNEYVELCNLSLLKREELLRRPNGSKCLHGYIDIKNTLVRVYRDHKKPKALLTALPIVAEYNNVIKIRKQNNSKENTEVRWSNPNEKWRKGFKKIKDRN